MKEDWFAEPKPEDTDSTSTSEATSTTPRSKGGDLLPGDETPTEEPQPTGSVVNTNDENTTPTAQEESNEKDYVPFTTIKGWLSTLLGYEHKETLESNKEVVNALRIEAIKLNNILTDSQLVRNAHNNTTEDQPFENTLEKSVGESQLSNVVEEKNVTKALENLQASIQAELNEVGDQAVPKSIIQYFADYANWIFGWNKPTVKNVAAVVNTNDQNVSPIVNEESNKNDSSILEQTNIGELADLLLKKEEATEIVNPTSTAGETILSGDETPVVNTNDANIASVAQEQSNEKDYVSFGLASGFLSTLLNSEHKEKLNEDLEAVNALKTVADKINKRLGDKPQPVETQKEMSAIETLENLHASIQISEVEAKHDAVPQSLLQNMVYFAKWIIGLNKASTEKEVAVVNSNDQNVDPIVNEVAVVNNNDQNVASIVNAVGSEKDPVTLDKVASLVQLAISTVDHKKLTQIGKEGEPGFGDTIKLEASYLIAALESEDLSDEDKLTEKSVRDVLEDLQKSIQKVNEEAEQKPVNPTLLGRVAEGLYWLIGLKK